MSGRAIPAACVALLFVTGGAAAFLYRGAGEPAGLGALGDVARDRPAASTPTARAPVPLPAPITASAAARDLNPVERVRDVLARYIAIVSVADRPDLRFTKALKRRDEAIQDL